MIAVNTNLKAMASQFFARANQLQFNEKVERLSSGRRVNRGADDPSGLAISSGMQSQLRGMNTAIANIQDVQNLLRLADKFLDDSQDVLMNVRDKSVRLANGATVDNTPLVGSDGDPQPPAIHSCMLLHQEIEVMTNHMKWSFTTERGDKVIPSLLNYNGKNIFDLTGVATNDLQRGFADGQEAQIGPDNLSSHQVTVIFRDIAEMLENIVTPYDPPPNPMGHDSLDKYVQYANYMIDETDDRLDMISDVRIDIGILDARLSKAINDMKAQYEGVAGSNSKIEDADMALEITELTKNQIISQTSQVAHSQATADQLITIPLLKNIYDGLGESKVFY